MMLKWFGAVSTRITLCRSNLSVSILWALAVSAMAMVKAMVFCMPKFPPIPALLQKPSGQCAVPGLGFPSSARGQILRYQTAYPLLEAGERLRSEEHTSELQSLRHLVCRLLL